MEETCEDNFLQRQAEARGDISRLQGASRNSTGDLCLSNDKTWISTDYKEPKHPDHKQTS